MTRYRIIPFSLVAAALMTVGAGPPPQPNLKERSLTCAKHLRALRAGRENAATIDAVVDTPCPGATAALAARFPKSGFRPEILVGLRALGKSPESVAVIKRIIWDPELGGLARAIGREWGVKWHGSRTRIRRIRGARLGHTQGPSLPGSTTKPGNPVSPGLSTSRGGFGGGRFGKVRFKDTMRAVVTTGRVTVSGDALTRPIVRKYINRQKGAVIYCYKRLLQKAPKLTANAVFSFTIGAKGGVSGMTVTFRRGGSPDLKACLVRRGSFWRFPAPRDGKAVRVTAPLLFRSK